MSCLGIYFFREFLDDRVAHFSTNYRTICLHDDVISVTIFSDGPLLTERMKLKKGIRNLSWKILARYLDLVYCWSWQTCFSDLFQVLDSAEC